jgi:hypothetical protein
MQLHTMPQQGVALVLSACLIVSYTPPAIGQSAETATSTQPGGDPWPRVARAHGATISIYQPQLQSWTGNLLDAYAAVTVKTQGSDAINYGVIWFTARTEVDKVNRVVTLADFSLTKRSFPTLPNNGLAYATAFQDAIPWTESMPLDELETALSTTSIDQQQQRVPVNNDPPHHRQHHARAARVNRWPAGAASIGRWIGHGDQYTRAHARQRVEDHLLPGADGRLGRVVVGQRPMGAGHSGTDRHA